MFHNTGKMVKPKPKGAELTVETEREARVPNEDPTSGGAGGGDDGKEGPCDGEGRRNDGEGPSNLEDRPEALLSASGAGHMLRETLLSSCFAHLVSSGPLASTDPFPSSQLQPIPDTPPALLNFVPKTPMENKLLLLLRESEARKMALQARLCQAQALNVPSENCT